MQSMDSEYPVRSDIIGSRGMFYIQAAASTLARVNVDPFPGYCGGVVLHSAIGREDYLHRCFDAVEKWCCSVRFCELFYTTAHRPDGLASSKPELEQLLKDRGYEVVFEGMTTKYRVPAVIKYYRKYIEVPETSRIPI